MQARKRPKYRALATVAVLILAIIGATQLLTPEWRIALNWQLQGVNLYDGYRMIHTDTKLQTRQPITDSDWKTLVRETQSQDASVRAFAAGSLFQLQHTARGSDAVALLRALCHDPDEMVRAEVMDELVVQCRVSDSSTLVENGLKDKSSHVREAATFLRDRAVALATGQPLPKSPGKFHFVVRKSVGTSLSHPSNP
jgi:hypothetical protein